MRCKLSFRFCCNQKEADEFIERFKKLDKSATVNVNNAMTIINSDGLPEPAKGLTAIADYDNLPKIVELTFKNKGVYLINVKTLWNMPKPKKEKPHKKRQCQTWQADEIQELKKMRAKGLSDATIANKLGRSEKSVGQKRRALEKQEMLLNTPLG